MGNHETPGCNLIEVLGLPDRPDAAEVPDAALEAGRKLFAQACEFVTGAVRLEDLPPEDLPEVAFAGRSNVGKSSLINALTGRKTLSRTSHTPGRTREINFFRLGAEQGPAGYLVDLPGYGYAKVSKQQSRAWTALMRDYLRSRATLRRICLLIDSRHGFKDSDHDIMALIESAAVPFQIVLTKIDKPKQAALDHTIAAVKDGLSSYAAAFPQIAATSALNGDGIAALRAGLVDMILS